MERGTSSLHYKSINVLVTGKSGTSKSILVNGIFGSEVVKERHGVVSVARSSEIDFYSQTIDGVTINVWVSAHLQDAGLSNEEEYLLDLKQKCSNVDLILYCLKMTETRFIPGNPDALAMAKLTNALGHTCWKKTVFVLTFANIAAEVLPDSQEKRQMFEDSIKRWKNIIQNTLSEEARVPQDSLDISVVPAGHYRELHLPDRNYWLSDLWKECYNAIQSAHSRDIIHQINRSRFRKASQITKSDLTPRSIMNHPLVFGSSNDYSKVKMMSYGAAVFGIIGFLVGSIWLRSFPIAIICFSFGVAFGGYLGSIVYKYK